MLCGLLAFLKDVKVNCLFACNVSCTVCIWPVALCSVPAFVPCSVISFGYWCNATFASKWHQCCAVTCACMSHPCWSNDRANNKSIGQVCRGVVGFGHNKFLLPLVCDASQTRIIPWCHECPAGHKPTVNHSAWKSETMWAMTVVWVAALHQAFGTQPVPGPATAGLQKRGDRIILNTAGPRTTDVP